MTQDFATIKDGNEAVTTSIKVAEFFGKQHGHVMEAIRRLQKQRGPQPGFQQTSYVHRQNGGSYPMYKINQEALSLLVMGFTGKRASKRKRQCLEVFDFAAGNTTQKTERKDMTQDLVIVNDSNEIVTDSLKVAEFFGKHHRHVLRDIEKLVDGGMPNFGQTPYINPQNGQTYRKYTMDRDGFSILAMGFNGDKALEFKLQFLAAFNAMGPSLLYCTSKQAAYLIATLEPSPLQRQVRQYLQPPWMDKSPSLSAMSIISASNQQKDHASCPDFLTLAQYSYKKMCSRAYVEPLLGDVYDTPFDFLPKVYSLFKKHSCSVSLSAYIFAICYLAGTKKPVGSL